MTMQTRIAIDPEDRDAWLVTCTVLTTTAEDDVGRIHDRMPLMVPPDRWAEWLDPANDDTDTAAALLEPAAPGALAAWPVATLVNNVKNNGPELVQPLEAADAPPDGSDDGALF